MKFLRGIGGASITFIGLILTITLGSGGYISVGGKLVFVVSTATAVGDAIPTGCVAGSLLFTTHATGKGQIFISDGTYLQDYFAVKQVAIIATVATSAGNTDVILPALFTGKLLAAAISFTDALTTHDTNYITASLININNSNADMLLATDVNTTKITGGSALAANTQRSLSLHGTAGNLAVTAGHRMRFRIAASGTLANTLTNGFVILTFQRS